MGGPRGGLRERGEPNTTAKKNTSFGKWSLTAAGVGEGVNTQFSETLKGKKKGGGEEITGKPPEKSR